MHLAEFNVAYPKYPLEDPRMEGFVNNLDRINDLAEKMDGYVWRYEGELDNPRMMMRLFGANSIPNMSVWETPEQLEHFVWNTVHKQIYNRKHEWFEGIQSHNLVMWWVEEGHRPSLYEASQRLKYLNENGDTDHAFSWKHLPHIKLWQTQQCA